MMFAFVGATMQHSEMPQKAPNQPQGAAACTGRRDRTVRKNCLPALVLATWIAGITFFTGCANTDANRARGEGAGLGAVIGAILGNVVGDGRGAIAGAVIGGLVGAGVGDHVAQRKAEYIQREDHLRAVASQAQQTERQARGYNEQLRQAIVLLEQTEQRLRTEAMTEQARTQLVMENRRRMVALLQQTDKAISDVRNQIAVQQAAIRAEQQAAIRAERQALARNEPQPARPEGIQLVAFGVRDLQIQERELQRAQAQLRMIDSRRAY